MGKKASVSSCLCLLFLQHVLFLLLLLPLLLRPFLVLFPFFSSPASFPSPFSSFPPSLCSADISLDTTDQRRSERERWGKEETKNE